jgi:NAD(P)-dependent dehydrogenase (short-subunit alcohol dehydrogenase family)
MPGMDALAGKTAVVTGGASGIGLALGEAFAAEGMNVVLADVEAGALEAATEKVGASGVEAHGVVCDVSDPEAVERLRDETVAAFGTVHVVCNNAGVSGGGPIWEVPLASWRWVLGVNLMGVVHGIRSFVPLLLEQGEGHIVNTASAAGLLTAPYLGPYTASKHAVVAISEALALELELAGANPGAVGVSVLCPMWVRTRIHEAERNAPPDVQAAIAAAGSPIEQGSAMRELITGLIEAGLDPQVVAGRVVSAVKKRRFYVLPHEEVKAGVVARAERIANDDAPQLTFGA